MPQCIYWRSHDNQRPQRAPPDWPTDRNVGGDTGDTGEAAMTDDELRQACAREYVTNNTRKDSGRFTKAITDLHRFMSHVKIVGECWIWTGAQVRGYGNFTLYGKTMSAHRSSYELHCGSIPPGLYVCHYCDVKLCVRPDHLFLGTAKDNMQDAKSKGLVPCGVNRYNAKLTPANVQAARSLLYKGQSLASIGRTFGVAAGTIHNIITRRTWAHLPINMAKAKELEKE